MSKKQLYKEYIKRHKGASVIGNLNDFQKGNGTFKIVPVDKSPPVSDSKTEKKSDVKSVGKRSWLKKRRESEKKPTETSLSEEEPASLITLRDTTEDALSLEDGELSEKNDKDGEPLSDEKTLVKKKRRFLFFWKRGKKVSPPPRNEDDFDVDEGNLDRTDMIIDGLMEKTTEDNAEQSIGAGPSLPATVTLLSPPIIPKLSRKEKRRAKKIAKRAKGAKKRKLPSSHIISIPDSSSSEEDVKTLADISEELESGRTVNVKDVFDAIPPIGKRIGDGANLDIDHLEIICEAVEFVLAEGCADPVSDVRLKYQVLTDIYTSARDKADITNVSLYRFIVILSKLILLETDTPISEEPEIEIEDNGREGMPFEIPKAHAEVFPSTTMGIRKLDDFSRQELRRKIKVMRSKNETLNKKFSYLSQLMRHFQKSSVEPNSVGRQLWEIFFFDHIIRIR